VAHDLVGEPVSTSPDHALDGSGLSIPAIINASAGANTGRPNAYANTDRSNTYAHTHWRGITRLIVRGLIGGIRLRWIIGRSLIGLLI
jgi:hypothetical protein